MVKLINLKKQYKNIKKNNELKWEKYTRLMSVPDLEQL